MIENLNSLSGLSQLNVINLWSKTGTSGSNLQQTRQISVILNADAYSDNLQLMLTIVTDDSSSGVKNFATFRREVILLILLYINEPSIKSCKNCRIPLITNKRKNIDC